MARRNLSLAFTFAALLFLFVTSAYARFPSDQTENDVSLTIITDDHNSDPNTTPTILLPSEKPQTEPATFVELEKEEIDTVDSKDSGLEKSDAQTDSLPVTRFRPINRHFSGRPFRRGHGCHGRRQHHFDQLKPRGGRQGQQLSYGNDMIISGGEDLGSDRQIEARWARFNLGGRNDRPHHHHHHHHNHDHLKEHEHDHHYYDGGFMNGIRKFLNNF